MVGGIRLAFWTLGSSDGGCWKFLFRIVLQGLKRVASADSLNITFVGVSEYLGADRARCIGCMSLTACYTMMRSMREVFRGDSSGSWSRICMGRSKLYSARNVSSR